MRDDFLVDTDRPIQGFRTPATTISPRAPAAGVRKAPRHEIASGDGAPAVPHAAGAADGYGDLVTGPAIRLE